MRFVIRLMILWGLVLIACVCVVYMPRLEKQYDTTSTLSLNDCTLPCWIGIVPGQTTIGQARKLIQDRYSHAFDIEMLKPYKDYTMGEPLKISARDQSHYLLVILNDQATTIQDDDSVSHEIEVYSYSDTNKDAYVPTVVDMMLVLGRPQCLATEWGNHTAWPAMLYPQYRAKLSFGTDD